MSSNVKMTEGPVRVAVVVGRVLLVEGRVLLLVEGLALLVEGRRLYSSRILESLAGSAFSSLGSMVSC